MTINVKDGGTFREVNQVYVHDGTSFTNKLITNVYVKDGGVWRNVFVLFATPSTFTTSDGSSIAVPANANAIHIQTAVGGGGGGNKGQDYDNQGQEQGGPGGGSGAFISDVVFSVTGGETLTRF